MKKSGVAANVLAGVMVAGLGAGLIGVTAGCSTQCCGCKAKKETVQMKNEDFYKDGKFDSAKAKQAYLDLMKSFSVPVYAELAKADGPFWAALRLYWPKPDALNGTWKAPLPEKV